MKQSMVRRITAAFTALCMFMMTFHITAEADIVYTNIDPLPLSLGRPQTDNLSSVWKSDDLSQYDEGFSFSDEFFEGAKNDAISTGTAVGEYGIGEAIGWGFNQLIEAEEKIRKGLETAYKTAKSEAVKAAEAASAEIKSIYSNVKSYFGGNLNKPNLPKATKNRVNKLKGLEDWWNSSKVKTAQGNIDASQAKSAALKGSKARCAGMLNAIFSWWNLRQTFNNPEFGYESPFFELLASELRFFSNTLLFLYPPAGLPLAVADLILTSSWFVWLVNKFGPRFEWLDNKVSGFNNWAVTVGWMRAWADKFFLDVVEKGQLAELEQTIKETQWKQNLMNQKMDEFFKELGVEKAVGATATANGMHVYKPNIYLYPTEPADVSVTFAHPTALTVTDPVYPADGWRAAADPDGTLSTGGEEYGFLFYEAVTVPGYYQTEKGFVITADSREETFTRILSEYGLNEREIADFTEFWCDKLDAGCDYAMYPQLTDVIDEAMPITVSPSPDSVLRIWFAFVKNDTPAEKAVIVPFERNGFTVVEWGGFFIGE